LYTATNNVGKQFGNKFRLSLQTNIQRLFPLGNGKQDTMFASVGVFLKTALYRVLPPWQGLRVTVTPGILQPLVYNNA
jgi:hypothetical protein